MHQEQGTGTFFYSSSPFHDRIGGTQRIPGTAWWVRDALTVLHSTGLQLVASNTLAGVFILDLAAWEDPSMQGWSDGTPSRIGWPAVYDFECQILHLVFSGSPSIRLT